MPTNPLKDPYPTDLPDDVKQLLAAGGAIGTPKSIPGYAPAVIVPEGWRSQTMAREELPPLPPLPDHIRARVCLHDAESFARYVNRYKDQRSQIFAPVNGGKFVAVLDYHDGTETTLQPQRCAHRASFAPVHTLEWQAWRKVDGTPMGQVDFINFIERQALDVVEPVAAKLMEFTANFSAKTDVAFSNRIDRVTGGVQLSYKEEIAPGNTKDGTMKIPEGLRLMLGVFEGGAAVEMKARLEWRPREGKLLVTVHLLQAAAIVRVALQEVREAIQTLTEIEPLTGEAPE